MGHKNAQIKVSVVVPVYNCEAYLEQCLDSILGQTLQEIEVICVDDGSTDDSLKLLKDYEKRDARLRAVSQANSGAGAARNRGLSLASGEYLSFLDSDDFFEPQMLEKAYAQARADAADLVVFHSDQYKSEENVFAPVSWVVRDADLPPYHPFNHRAMTGNVFKVFVGWAWDKLFLRSFVEEHQLRYQEQRTTNDMLFVFSAVVLANRISICPDVLVHQRRDAKDSLSKTRENSWHCFYDALLALRERLKQEHLYKELEKDFINYALHFTLWNYNTLAEPTRSMLVKALDEGWLEELGIKGKGREYFYNKKEYDKYAQVFALWDPSRM